MKKKKQVFLNTQNKLKLSLSTIFLLVRMTLETPFVLAILVLNSNFFKIKTNKYYINNDRKKKTKKNEKK